MTNLFSVSALFIMYREALEACVVISVMLSIMGRLGLHRLKRQVWWGAISGVLTAVLLGVIFVIIFYVLGNTVFQGPGAYAFKGFTSIIASALILWLSFALLKFMGYEAKWERKLAGATVQAADLQAARRQKFSVFILAYTTTVREGIESVLFLTSVSASTGAESIPIPGIVGVFLGVLTGMALFYSGRLVKDIKWFFYFSTIFLLFVGAGLARNGIHYFQLAQWCGTWYPYWERPWQNRPMFRLTCCSNIGNNFWSLIGALFGYQDDPTPLEWIFYFGFWVLAAIIFAVKLRRGTLIHAESRKQRMEREMAMSTTPLLCAQCGKQTTPTESEATPSETEGRNSEEAAGEPSCGGRCILSDQPSGQLDDGLEKQHDIEAANPLNSVAIDAANPLSSDIAPAAGTEQPPATGVSGRLAKLKQMLWRRD